MRRLFCVLLLVLSGCLGGIYNNTVMRVDIGPVEAPLGGGTGFAISSKYVMSAGHVCAVATEHQLTYMGIPLKVIKIDVTTDLCLLESEKPLTNWLTFSDVEPDPGDAVVIAGFPLGVPTLIETRGFFSGAILFPGQIVRWVLACHAYSGNSGGPVLNSDGKVIGVLVGGVPEYPQVTIAVPLSTIRTFLGGQS